MKRIKYVGLYSGGKDSVVACHVMANKVKLTDVLYAKTGVGLKENVEFVEQYCKKMGWNLIVCEPKEGEHYEDYVRKFGFPHQPMHSSIMGFLKYHPWRKWYKEHKDENIVLVSGRRVTESKRRNKLMRKIKFSDDQQKDREKYQEEVQKMIMKETPRKIHKGIEKTQDGLRFAAPILTWSTGDIWWYIRKHQLEISPIYKTMHMSGDCLCGSMAKKEESFLLSTFHPETAQRIQALEQLYGGKWGNNTSITDALKQNTLDSFICTEDCKSGDI